MTNPRQFPTIFLASNQGARQLTRKMAEICEFEKNIAKLTKKNPSSYLIGNRRHPKDRVAGLPF